jgi:hypothetical protein
LLLRFYFLDFLALRSFVPRSFVPRSFVPRSFVPRSFAGEAESKPKYREVRGRSQYTVGVYFGLCLRSEELVPRSSFRARSELGTSSSERAPRNEGKGRRERKASRKWYSEGKVKGKIQD